MKSALTLAQLSEGTGVPSRTIRSWVAERLVPGPVTRGRGATYPREALARVQQVRMMREAGLSAEEIRQRLQMGGRPEVTEVVNYQLRRERPEIAGLVESLRVSWAEQITPALRGGGFTALDSRLGISQDYDPRAGARSSDWVSFAVTPDVELNVRGPISNEQRALIGRCAAEIGRILVASTEEDF